MQPVYQAVPDPARADLTTHIEWVISGVIYDVYGGSDPANSTHGWIYLNEVPIDPCASPTSSSVAAAGDYPAPSNAGAITLTGASGSTVNFRTSSGQMGTFNVASRTYGAIN